ncbi:DNA repair protein RecO [Candidatus Omnitrophota bacterium]
MITKTQAFVLRSYKFRESSLIVSLYTKECGKVKAVAKGVHRIKSKKIAHFELFNLLELTMYEKPNRELQLVTDSSIVNYYGTIRENFDLSINATYIVELIDKMTHVHLPNDTLFRLMSTYFGSIKPSNYELFTLAFEVKLLKLLGIFPNLTHCITCKEPIDFPSGISFEQGGALCDKPGCSDMVYDVQHITRNEIVFLFKLIKDPFHAIGSYTFEKLDYVGIKDLINSYIAYLTDNKLKTQKVMEELRNTQLEHI